MSMRAIWDNNNARFKSLTKVEANVEAVINDIQIIADITNPVVETNSTTSSSFIFHIT